MTTITNLSANAQKLYSVLKQTGGAWEEKLIELIFEKPAYPLMNNENREEKQRAYWQWDVNMYGNANTRPVGAESVLFEPTDNFGEKLSAAYQELRKAGYANEKNSGYNTYWFYPTK